MQKTTSQKTTPQKIIIDTDPGQDDAVALLLALASPDELDVLGVVTVAGNVGLAQNSINALKIIELSGRPDTKIYAGCDRPMRRTPVTAEHVHGQTGLDGPDLPDPKITLQDIHGVDFIIRTLQNTPEKQITLCALGPLTNIAMALVRAPEIAPRIKEIVLMGGGYFEGGNITPTAEFNIYVDPEAADIVLQCGAPITIIPLDVTHGALATKDRVNSFAKMGNNTGTAIHQMLTFSERFDLEKYQWRGAPLHDPCVIAYVLEPDMFTGRLINVEIEVASELTRGMTVADFWGVTQRKPNATFMRHIDDDRYYTMLNERLKRLP
ncbi:MAG: nucleoside hydrolase [Devosiaceae bacterium]|nr:nucleoside hydrolase [Devosiaceae bacterium]